MTLIENIIKQSARPVGRVTLGRLVIALAAFLIVIAGFGYLADEVTEGETQITDTNILQLIHTISSPALNSTVEVVTIFGGVGIVFLLTLCLIACLAQMRRWRAAVFTGFTMGGTLIIFSLLKLLFERQRPFLYNLVSESTYSFPSGHASLSFALALTVIILAWHSRWRWAAVVGGTLYVLVIGFSRMYLAVHYPTDILAGWLLALAWTLAVATLVGAIRWKKFSK